MGWLIKINPLFQETTEMSNGSMPGNLVMAKSTPAPTASQRTVVGNVSGVDFPGNTDI